MIKIICFVFFTLLILFQSVEAKTIASIESQITEENTSTQTTGITPQKQSENWFIQLLIDGVNFLKKLGSDFIKLILSLRQ